MPFVRLHPLLDAARSLGILPANFFPAVARGSDRIAFALLQRGEQPLTRELSVHPL